MFCGIYVPYSLGTQLQDICIENDLWDDNYPFDNKSMSSFDVLANEIYTNVVFQTGYKF